MSLAPFRNNNPLSLFKRDMNRLFEDVLGSDDESLIVGAQWPRLNIKEDDKQITVEAEVPGMTKDDVKATVVRDVLTLSGEKAETKKEEKENYVRTERSYGSFRRQVRLPAEVDTKHAEARLDNGLLTLKLPKSAPSENPTITIK